MRKFIVATAVVMTLAGLAAPTVRYVQDAKRLAEPGAMLALNHGDTSSPYIQAFVSWVGDYVVKMFGSVASSHVAAIEKAVVGVSQLKQGEMNMDAGVDAAKRYASSGDKFNAAPERTCRVLNEEMEARLAATLNQVNQKAISRHMTRRLVSGQDSAKSLEEVMGNHNALYCSATDVDRGKCTHLSTMQNADVMASTLFVPEGSETLSKEQARAAMDYIRVATSPDVVENIPAAFEKTAAGQRHMLEKLQANSMESMVSGSMARILASRTARN